MSHAKFSVLIVLILVVGVLATVRHYAKAKALLQAWADANGYKILHARQSSLFMPLGMFFSTSKYQLVYHVAVYDASIQRIRSAWVRLGSYWWGVMNDDAIEVRWEHEG